MIGDRGHIALQNALGIGLARGIVHDVGPDGTVVVTDATDRLLDVLTTASGELRVAPGDEVVYWLPEEPNARGVVFGRIGESAAPVVPALAVDVEPAKPETLVLEATSGLTLRVGEAFDRDSRRWQDSDQGKGPRVARQANESHQGRRGFDQLIVPAPLLTFLPDLLEEHLEEIQFLWPIRERGLRSPRMTMRDIRNFEDRVDAHIEGATIPGEDALPYIEPLLEADDDAAAFTATMVLLRLGTERTVTLVRDALSAAKGKRLTGIGRAIEMARSDALLEDLGAMFRGDDPARAAVAAEVLCYRVRWKGSHDRLLAFLDDENPAIRCAGWRIVANLAISAEPKRYAAAMRDDDPAVREAALHAAAWTGVGGALGIARAAAGAPSKDDLPAYRMLAALGEPTDLGAIQRLVQTSDLGPERFSLATAFGHSGLAPLLLDAMRSTDKRAAIAAGHAFARLTGADLGTGDVVTLPPDDGSEPDDFDKEFLDEDTLPDPAKAHSHWDRVRGSVSAMSRAAHGRDISAALPPDAFAWLDMQARYEWWMRARFRGTWSGTPMQLEVFPQHG